MKLRKKTRCELGIFRTGREKSIPLYTYPEEGECSIIRLRAAHVRGGPLRLCDGSVCPFFGIRCGVFGFFAATAQGVKFPAHLVISSGGDFFFDFNRDCFTWSAAFLRKLRLKLFNLFPQMIVACIRS